jgi:hypothetical protein
MRTKEDDTLPRKAAAAVAAPAPDTALVTAAVTLKHKASSPAKLMQNVFKTYQELVSTKLARKQLHDQLMATPPGQQLSAYDTQIQALTEQLKGLLKDTRGVVETPFGKVGYEIRRKVTYTPGLIRKLLPDFAKQLIGETVDTKTVDAFVKAGIKSKTMDESIAEDLANEADVDETSAWIDKPLAETK